MDLWYYRCAIDGSIDYMICSEYDKMFACLSTRLGDQSSLLKIDSSNIISVSKSGAMPICKGNLGVIIS